ncbi:MAG: nucleotidyltransferase domain-containing protein [Anaerolineales bacterium]|nr:nucleotidyltransferase domain-containing protein [Anaerolineales bacterium]MCB8991684.1 nucleotidyltransferase domain-containing protein [Ardenticatenaceae bacterium]MCB9005552.1 nucleotidyltransferase domain-containing protein [Ardenticatenaceae bacterium]
MELTTQQLANQIIANLQANAPGILAQYPVALAYLHGSVARCTSRPASDIDIALLLRDTALSAYEQMKLTIAIEIALETQCGLANLDVRAINSAPILVQGRIVQEGIRLYERDKNERIAFEVLTRKKYFDYLPTAEWMQQAMFDSVRRKGLSYG